MASALSPGIDERVCRVAGVDQVCIGTWAAAHCEHDGYIRDPDGYITDMAASCDASNRWQW